jgi:hypothetical protein
VSRFRQPLIIIGKFACLTGAYVAAALAVAAVYARDGGMTFADIFAGISSPIFLRALAILFVVCGGMALVTWPSHKPVSRFYLIGGILGSAIASLAAGASVGSFWFGVGILAACSAVFRVYQLRPDLFRLGSRR